MEKNVGNHMKICLRKPVFYSGLGSGRGISTALVWTASIELSAETGNSHVLLDDLMGNDLLEGPLPGDKTLLSGCCSS